MFTVVNISNTLIISQKYYVVNKRHGLISSLSNQSKRKAMKMSIKHVLLEGKDIKGNIYSFFGQVKYSI